MNNIYMRIVGMASGNVILQIWNSGLTFLFFFSFQAWKKYQTIIKLLFLLLVLVGLK
jgi:hypothetical protein